MNSEWELGNVRLSEVLQPVTGKAVPVHPGEVLKITLIEGPQCVDFNCFALNDYKERMSVGHMRRTGFRVETGSIIWSAPPRYNPMMVVLDKPDSCVTDLLAARCHATQFEKERGYPGTHTNCQDTFAEAIAEYNLTPDDVHDSLNMWMNTGWDDAGNFIPNVRPNTGKAGDAIYIMALMDVLAVPIVCGSGDVSNTSNYWTRPIQIDIHSPSSDTNELAQGYWQNHTGYINQRTPDQFKVSSIRTERRLNADPDYRPEYVNHPLKIESIELELSDHDLRTIDRLMDYGIGLDTEEVIRTAVMMWLTRNRSPQIKREVPLTPRSLERIQ